LGWLADATEPSDQAAAIPHIRRALSLNEDIPLAHLELGLALQVRSLYEGIAGLCYI
jgi:hypothetical protein